jgi:hypothetical protein
MKEGRGSEGWGEEAENRRRRVGILPQQNGRKKLRDGPRAPDCAKLDADTAEERNTAAASSLLHCHQPDHAASASTPLTRACVSLPVALDMSL